MDDGDRARIETFLTTWQDSQGNERANYQTFFVDLCDALGVDRPPPKGNVADDPYCFDKDIRVYHPSGKVTAGYIDFYKADCFLVEAKQGSDRSGKGTAKRGTATYQKAMEKAFVQAIAYTRNLPNKPPFVLTCDIGWGFQLWTGFNGDYGGYAARQDIDLAALQQADTFDLFVDIFTNPEKRNPEKIAAQVTREVASDLAALTKTLEGQHDPEAVALFLMRCIFTMFAEDVGLLKEQIFTQALESRWVETPKQFKPEVEALWRAMNEGTDFGFHGTLLRFNGGLFHEPTAFPLSTAQLEVMLAAAKRDWQNVEPAIFGTLLERALDPKERSKLGAHYTPRSYVERLVRPVVMEPLQEQWQLVQAEVKQLLGDAPEPKPSQTKKAVAALEAFLTELRQVRILDPACGTGNFLYVTLDLIKQLESEVLKRLEDITGQSQLRLDIDQVNPSQFLGIEINPRAATIADLVIWIGYLQWHFRRFGNLPPVEPVLREYQNIENRDAVLAYDGKELDVDPKTGKVRTRWGGKMMTHPVTGEEVPDPSDQVTIYRYLNPRPAEWPEADYVVSNPPFIGKIYMRESLGDGYAEALRQTYKAIPDSVDLVMYWWEQAANLNRQGEILRFGFISTNSISQTYNRRVIKSHLGRKSKPLGLFFAIPDHPWVDSQDGAAIRISMTAAALNIKSGNLTEVVSETDEQAEEKFIEFRPKHGLITPSLTVGIDLQALLPLKANEGMACVGYQLTGQGFVVTKNTARTMDSDFGKEESNIWPLLSGRDITQRNRELFAIDLFGWGLEKVKREKPEIFQWILDRVKPEREQNNNPTLRERWWTFEKNRNTFRPALETIQRVIATSLTSKHRFFVFSPAKTIADSTTVLFALPDAYFLGVLSSHIHRYWALKAGGTLEDRPRYIKTLCFDPFPFPDPTPDQKAKIRELGERLDAHRKQVQAAHADITITSMYNLLEKLRAGEPFTDKDRDYNNRALVSTLKQIHDELDEAVFAAYGWEPTLSDEEILEKLVALNAERAEEERNGLVRWLRPEYQAPDEVVETQQTIAGVAQPEPVAVAPVEQQKLPRSFKEQLAAVRNLLRSQGGEWTLEQVVAQFKNASRKKKAIQECLESLEELGIVATHEEEGATRWYLAELQQAG